MAGTIAPFLRSTPPFDQLDEAELHEVLGHIEMRKFEKGTHIHRQGGPPGTYLYIVQEGAVKIYVEDSAGGESLIDFAKAGETFGVMSLIDGKVATAHSETVEDTLCLLLPKDHFWYLVGKHAAFSEHFSKSLAKRLKRTLGTVTRVTETFRTEIDVTSRRTGELIAKNGIISCPADTDMRAAARIMVDNNVGSIVVLGADGALEGIATDTDLRRALASSYEGPVSGIMSSPVVSVPAETFAFEAMYEMLKHNIHHVVVVDGGWPRGVLSSSDLLAAQSESPLFLTREIDRATSYAQLAAIHARTQAMVGALLARGASAYDLGRITAETNDRLVQRVLAMVQTEIATRGGGAPPVPFCWLALGSEGRREQTLTTDQDNALIYVDTLDDRTQEARLYFQLFASRAIEELVGIGFPPCKGNVMASNPQWCQPLSAWKQYFSTWIRESEPHNLLNATIFFDFRPIWGELFLAEELREHLNREVSTNKIFTGRLAKAALDQRPPLGFFKNIVVEKTGAHRGSFDVKLRAILPLVDAIRVYALERTVAPTNTFERIRALEQASVFAPEEAGDIAGAYEFLMALRIRHQLSQIKEGRSADNFVNPDQLAKAEKKQLRDSFAVTSSVQSYLESHFLTWFIS